MTVPLPSTAKRGDLAMAAMAALFFIPLFIFRSIGPLDFWWRMSASIALLIALSLALDRSYAGLILSDFKNRLAWKIGIGIFTALSLYAVFYAGNRLSRQILPFAGQGIGWVYGFKAGVSPLRIVLLMVCLIGPGEEFFWRGYLQRCWQARLGPFRGWLLATALYALVHSGSGNIMFVLAAGICGLFWGFLYLRFKSVLLVAVSHTLWDLLVFLVLPFG
jgi:membrane protease YdiL (CAAX protease family)